MTIFDDILSKQKGNFVKFKPLDKSQQNKKDIQIQRGDHKVARYDFNPFGFLLFKKRFRK